MALATRCPNCHALFRVVADQLKLRGGLVRCGACGHAFDAIGTLSYLDDASLRPVEAPPASGGKHDDPSVTLRFAPGGFPVERTPADPDEPRRADEDADRASHRPADQEAEETAATVEADAVAQAEITPVSIRPTETQPRTEAEECIEGAVPEATASPTVDTDAADDTVDAAKSASIGADTPNAIDEAAAPDVAAAFLQEQPLLRRKSTILMYAIGTALLSMMLLIQLALMFRSELIAQWPATRPALARLCQPLNCSVGWPTRGELLAVVGSELQSLPGTGALELTAVVRNRASITLALPALEVTLTDTQNRAVARKIFAPAEYLAADGASARIGEGIEAGADMTVRIIFEARGINAAGFVVYPFYL